MSHSWGPLLFHLFLKYSFHVDKIWALNVLGFGNIGLEHDLVGRQFSWVGDYDDLYF